MAGCCDTAGTYYGRIYWNAGASLDSHIFVRLFSIAAGDTCVCGNGNCQSAYGETCPSCPGDCPGFNTNNYCNGGWAYGCGYTPVTNPAGKGVLVNMCQQAGSSGYYCDTAAGSSPQPYWSSTDTFIRGATLCTGGSAYTCNSGNMCQQAGSYYCAPNGSWSTSNPIINGSIICYNGQRLIANSTLRVSARNISGGLMDNVNVSVLDDKNKALVLGSRLTNSTGAAWFNLSMTPGYPFREITIMAKKSGFSPYVLERFPIYWNLSHNTTISMQMPRECLSDCTRTDDPYSLCDATCDGVNGCSFFSGATKNICTLPQQAKGTRKVISSDGENDTAVYCCKNATVIEKKSNLATIECPKENIVKLTKIVIIDGEPVKMNVVACER